MEVKLSATFARTLGALLLARSERLVAPIDNPQDSGSGGVSRSGSTASEFLECTIKISIRASGDLCRPAQASYSRRELYFNGLWSSFVSPAAWPHQQHALLTWSSPCTPGPLHTRLFHQLRCGGRPAPACGIYPMASCALPGWT